MKNRLVNQPHSHVVKIDPQNYTNPAHSEGIFYGSGRLVLFKILKKLVKARSTHKVTPTSVRDKDVVQAKIPKVYLTSGLSSVV